jgi:hypothetical protein
MAITSQLKKIVDIPVWEWLRPLLISTSATSSAPNTFVTAGKPYARYIYHIAGVLNGMFRYDTWSDSWGQVSGPSLAQQTVAASRFNDSHGYFGRVISSPSTSTLQIAAPVGNQLVGLKIKILNGAGAGQERTITSVADTVVADTLSVTTAATVRIVDSSKSYTTNQYRDFAVRIIGNSNTEFRKILYNTATELFVADNRFATYGNRWAYSPIPFTTVSTAGSQTFANIESNVITVNTPFTVQPDNTSEFVIEGGGIWNVSVGANRFALLYYDIIGDAWYTMTSPAAGLLNGNLVTDVAIETLNETAVGIVISGNISSATNTSVDVTTNNFTTDQYSGYIIRIKSGTGVGQERLVVSNDSNTINVSRAWSTNPNNTSTYEIVADYEKMYMIGNGASAMLEYDSSNDVWADKRILEAGLPTNLCAVFAGYKKPIGISTITRSTTTATVTTVHPHGLKTGETVTVYGATDALYNITATITVTGDSAFTYTMAGTPVSAASAVSSQSTTLLVDPTKNWATNSLVGDMLSYYTAAYTATAGSQQNIQHCYITANTATTITFVTATSAPIAGQTPYWITDLRNNGGIFASTVSAATTTSITIPTTVTANLYRGRRCVITDGQNWAETAISSHTASVFTLSTTLAFTPTTSAVFSVLGNSPTGAGCSLEYLYNTSIKQKGRYLFGIRGGTTNHFLLYDITSNTWEILGQRPGNETFELGTMTSYDGDNRVYFHRNATGRIYYYDFTDNNLYNAGTIPYGMGSATLGNRMSIIKTEDGLKFLYIPRHSGQEFWRLLLFT